MARWEPGTADRLRRAALDLYLEQGYDATTIGQIAERAGVSERTYFRHFPDKREVLFDPDEGLLHAVVDGIEGAPADAAIPQVMDAGLSGAAGFFTEERRAWARARQRALSATLALRERETLKLEAMRTAIAASLTRRGADAVTSSVAAGIAMAVFVSAFEAWVAPEETRPMAELQALMRARVTLVT